MKSPAAPDPISAYILLGITAQTGIVDAVSFFALGHIFTANMTGNVVFLGFALVGAAGFSISRSSLPLIAFLLGAEVWGEISSRVKFPPLAATAPRALLQPRLFFVASALAALHFSNLGTLNCT